MYSLDRTAAVVALCVVLAPLWHAAPAAACSCVVLEEVLSPREGEPLALDGAIVFLGDGTVPTLSEVDGAAVPLQIEQLGRNDLWFHCEPTLYLARPVTKLSAGASYELRFGGIQRQLQAGDVPGAGAPELALEWRTGDPVAIPDDGIGCSGHIPARQYQVRLAVADAEALPLIVVAELSTGCDDGYSQARLLSAEGSALAVAYTDAAVGCVQISTYDLQGRLLSSEPACPPQDVPPAVPTPSPDCLVIGPDAGGPPGDAGTERPVESDAGPGRSTWTNAGAGGWPMSGSGAADGALGGTGVDGASATADGTHARHARYCFCATPGMPRGDAPPPTLLLGLCLLVAQRRLRGRA